MPLSNPLARLQMFLAAATLVAALVLGGGQGTLGDGLVQLMSLALVVACMRRHASDPDARLPPVAWLAAVPLLLPLVQLLPLPEGLWSLPAARRELAAELAAAGVDPATRWSLVPLATERALVWLLPAAALFLSTLQLQAGSRTVMLQLVVAGAAASAVLGLAQLAGGPESALRLYAQTNPTEAVGFFANRNHLASLLAVSLPLVVVGTAVWYSRCEELDARALFGLAVGAGLVALMILGIAISRSRAGLLLGMLALLGSLPIVLALRRRRGTRRALAVAVSLGLMLVVQFALFGILQKMEKDPLEDGRFQYLPVVQAAAREHAPLGSGLGGFRRAFEAEYKTPGTAYVNHAHNDWAEVWLEGGWLGRLLLLAAAGGLVVSGWRVWRPGRHGSAGQRAIARVAWLGMLLLALHSLGDYPMRKTAILAVAGVLAACLVAPGRPAFAHPTTRTQDSHAA